MDYCHQQESKCKGKTLSYNVVCSSSRETKIDIASLTDSKEEEIVLAAAQSVPPVVGALSDQQYLKKYDEEVQSSSKPTKEPVKQSMK